MMKLTKKIALEVAINAIEEVSLPQWTYNDEDDSLIVTKDEAIEKLRKMIESLDAKASAPKKPTAKQTENENLKVCICEAMKGQSPKTISEIMTLCEELKGMSNQKVSSLVRTLVADGILVRTEEKRKAYFALAQS